MPTLMSPGVAIVEKDFSNIVPSIAIGNGAIAGRFTTGPIGVPVMISSEDQLYATFGGPNEINYLEWFTVAQFLSYSSSCWVVRAKPSGVTNANSGASGAVAIMNENEYYDPVNGFTSTEATVGKEWIAKTAGTIGNHVAVIAVDTDSWTNFEAWSNANLALFPAGIGLSSYFTAVPGMSSFVASKAADTTNRKDEMHILVVDLDGYITGTKWTVLEKYQGVSKCLDAVDYKGTSIYYPNVVNSQSAYIWFGGYQGAAATATTSTGGGHTVQVTSSGSLLPWGTTSDVVAPIGKSFGQIDVTQSWTINSATVHFQFLPLSGAVAGSTPTDSDIIIAYQLLQNKDKYEANLFMTAAYSVTVVQSVVNVVTSRKDAMAFITPRQASSISPIFDTTASPASATAASIVTFQIAEMDGQYCVADTGWKYIFDRYSGKYRWIPLNGDIAGIIARNDQIANPWWSPGGFNRGGLKNVIKLAYNPSQSDRDALYPKGINPVVAFPGQGVVLFGDRTMTQKPSAFDRINVRRLFIILEKSISTAAKYQLFEFNDTFTRAQFKNMVEPFLRQIKGSRGITDFMVVCDATNNTGQVIDSNQFVADIYVKPARSINFITLNFVATRSDVAFSTVVGG